MSLDGIRIVKKKVRRNQQLDQSADSGFWDIDSIQSAEKTTIKKNTPIEKSAKNLTPKFHFNFKISWPEFWQETKTYLLNSRMVLSILGVILIVFITSVSVFSYKFINANYEFIKLFKSVEFIWFVELFIKFSIFCIFEFFK